MANPIVAWLNKVRDGLGTHAHVFEEYGATTVADLGSLDDDDINAIGAALEAEDERPLPLQIKQIVRALRNEIALQAGRDGAFHTPRTAPSSTKAGSSSFAADKCTAADESDEDEEEDDDFDEDLDDDEEDANEPKRQKRAARVPGPSASTARHRSRNGKEAVRKTATAAAAGKAKIADQFGRSASAKNWHGVGGQASAAAAAAGRARPFGGLRARSKGQTCVNPCGQIDGHCTCPTEAEYPDRCAGPQRCGGEQPLLACRECTCPKPFNLVSGHCLEAQYVF